MTTREFVFLLFCATVTIVTSQYEEGRPCEFGDDVGTCLKPENCNNKNVPRCPIRDYVCCTPEVNSRSMVRKSIQACKEIADNVGHVTRATILGGKIAELGEFPHMAGLGYERPGGGPSNALSYSCGGSLISDQFVLTAAHCLNARSGPPIQVRLGKVDIYGDSDEAKPQDFNISKIHVHPNYSRRTRYHDIGLIKLSRKVRINVKTVYPACLYQNVASPRYMSVAGWGKLGTTGDGSTILLKANLSSVPFTPCKTQYIFHPVSQTIIEDQLCAKSEDGTQDTCEGDSGGPLQIKPEGADLFEIVGVTSFGMACDGKFPGLYTRVYSYLSWIESIVWP